MIKAFKRCSAFIGVLCKVCANSCTPEDTYHFIVSCPTLKRPRTHGYQKFIHRNLLLQRFFTNKSWVFNGQSIKSIFSIYSLICITTSTFVIIHIVVLFSFEEAIKYKKKKKLIKYAHVLICICVGEGSQHYI